MGCTAPASQTVEVKEGDFNGADAGMASGCTTKFDAPSCTTTTTCNTSQSGCTTNFRQSFSTSSLKGSSTSSSYCSTPAGSFSSSCNFNWTYTKL